MYKVAFFDVDGTLMSFRTHGVPESARRAIRAMRERGIVPVICTGRLAKDVPAEATELIDDVVSVNGQFCVVGGSVVRCAFIDPEDVRVVVEQVEQGLYEAFFMFADHSFVSRRTPRVLEVSRQVGIEYVEGDARRALEEPVFQMCAFVGPGEEGVILDRTRSVAATRWTDLFCDLVPREGGKDFGVRAVLEHLGASPDEAIAFGDGENDLPMFAACGTSVAMGNAYGMVRERADYVTTSVDDDGIWNAAVHFGLV